MPPRKPKIIEESGPESVTSLAIPPDSSPKAQVIYQEIVGQERADTLVMAHMRVQVDAQRGMNQTLIAQGDEYRKMIVLVSQLAQDTSKAIQAGAASEVARQEAERRAKIAESELEDARATLARLSDLRTAVDAAQARDRSLSAGIEMLTSRVPLAKHVARSMFKKQIPAEVFETWITELREWLAAYQEGSENA